MKLYTRKDGWEEHIDFKFPLANFWGIVMLVGLIAGDPALTIISFMFFLLLSITRRWQEKREDES